MSAPDVHAPDAPAPVPRGRLLQWSDLPLALGLMALGLGLRLRWYSGFGLGDDSILKGEINSLITNHTVLADNGSYRIMWWFPTVASCRFFGLTELGLLLPIMTAATLGIGLVYLIGKSLWGRPGGVIAALLLIFHPLDFAWSTMLASDFIASFWFGATIFCTLRATSHPEVEWRRRFWVLAAVGVWCSYHTKFSGILLLAPIGLIALTRWRSLDRSVWYFVATMAFLVPATAFLWYGLTGDVLAPLHYELFYQGLTGPQAVTHAMNAITFWLYPRWFFYPDQLGDLLHSVYPHLLVLFIALGWLMGLRSSLEIFWWLLLIFLGMQFNVQRVEGVWITGFRNIRHGHVFVYPLVLLLAGYFAGLWRRLPRTTTVLLAALLAVSFWQAIQLATKTRVAFADRRDACTFIGTLKPKLIFADFQVRPTCELQRPPGMPNSQPWTWREPHAYDRAIQKQELMTVTNAYLVTGGAREPYYGCLDCILRADDVPRDRWKLLKEFPDPLGYPTPWRSEPVRLWESIPPPTPSPPPAPAAP